MEMKFMFVPVGDKQDDQGKSFFYCPKTRRIFGPLQELIVELHQKPYIECHCFNILSKQEDSKLIIEYERSNQNMHSMCTLKIYYKNLAHLGKLEKIINLYIENYNKGKSVSVKLPKFQKPAGMK
ncbi:MAG: hypothetical protein ACPLXC_02295 [Candidatus Pacearchaeota archaeon]